jgi:hypothetical protein
MQDYYCQQDRLQAFARASKFTLDTEANTFFYPDTTHIQQENNF